MPTLIKEERFILADIANNNNKFWNIELYDDHSVITRWGRVGETGQSKSFPHRYQWDAQNFYDRKVREKTGKGYTAQRTVTGTVQVKVDGSTDLAQVAKAQIATNAPELDTLIARLAKANIHNILQATTLQFDASKGTFSTPLGLVTQDAIMEARGLLGEIGNLVFAKNWDGTVPFLNKYLRLIPQDIGRKKLDPHEFLPDLTAVQEQNSILDSLEASFLTATAQDDVQGKRDVPKLFDVSLNVVNDPAVLARISKKYLDTLNRSHQCAHLRVKKAYELKIATMATAFDQKGRPVGDVRELWHGTRVGNVLSILKGGFVIPPSNAAHCTGRLFGNGLYFAIQSTKSLNYSYGYWDNRSRDENCFMFLVDVAMGKHYVPRYGESLPKPGYDSTWAKPGHSGIQNDEIIVYRTWQANPTYLIEFSPNGR